MLKRRRHAVDCSFGDTMLRCSFFQAETAFPTCPAMAFALLFSSSKYSANTHRQIKRGCVVVLIDR
jgi:hypothetical protein